MVVQPDGRVVCSGSATVAGTSSATLIRYLDDGRRDPTFGVQGAVRLDWGPGSSANGTLVLASGELVVVGKATGASGDSALAVAVLEQGGNVKASQAFELGAADEARAVVLAPSGDVLVFGALRGVGGNDLLVVRLTTRPEPPAGGVRLLVGPSCSSAGAGLSPLLLLALWRFRPKSTRKSTEAAIHR